MSQVPVDEVLSLLEPDFDLLEMGRVRMARVWRNEPPDHLPVLVGGALPERSEYPHYSLAEQFDDPENLNGAGRGLILHSLPVDPGMSVMDAVRTWRALA